jgi:rare lipoprotein A
MTWTIWTAAGLALACSLVSGEAGASGSKKISGVASFYNKDYQGKTASGERYDPNKFTCAHRTLPFGTHIRITDLKTHRSVEVIVNDRGPFTKGRVLDLSFAAAKALRMPGRGLIKVTAAVE